MIDSAAVRAEPDAADRRRYRRVFLLVFVVAMCGKLIDGYVQAVGPGLAMATRELEMTALWQGLVGAAALIGCFAGSPLFGWLTDRYGRKPLVVFTMAAYLVGCLAQLWVTDEAQLFAVRLFIGFVIGAEYVVTSPMVAEFAPAEKRGTLLASLQFGWYVGFILAYVIGYLVAEASPDAWRLPFAGAAVLAAIGLLLALRLPESPAWLAGKGRREEAERLIERRIGPAYDLAAFAPEADPTTPDTDTTPQRSGLALLLSPEYRSRTIFVCVFWACSVLPYFAIGTFAPQVLAALGLGDGLAASVATSILAVIGSAAGVLFVDRSGRRPLILTTFWVSGVALAVIGLWSGAPVVVVVVCFLVFSSFNAAQGVLPGVYPKELFPARVRATASGIGSAVSRAAAAAGTFLLPMAMDAFGVTVTLTLAAGFLFVGALVSHALAPETRGKSLAGASTSRG
ncbi:Inner membrane metabolite transport protein YgcS [Streptomyces sp. YIM 130001]|uniref:MFS transporter n=1 Tax=Streptomyces sp. YIM 130001 TaxID=2259644 RepID=UPI000E657987|nr:MFS transporter [Streptomyces sp. YIM 130001]RII22136.1 Inner membrane metabolite transport protein YgcS [Streptomyces sp. YIM 130001]